MGRAAATLLILLLAACAPPPPQATSHDSAGGHPLTEKIWLVDENRFISAAQLARRFHDAQFVLVGEQHDNPRHQAIEAWVVRALVEASRRPALVMEMIAADQAPGLALFFSEPRLNAQGLDLFLKWDQSGWGAWDRYRPVFDAAILGQMPIRAGNLDRGLLPKLHRDGFKALPGDEKARLELPAAVPEAQATPLAQAIRDGHCGQLPEALVSTFIQIQYARDASLARALMDGAAEAEGAVLISGAEHARTDRGAPVHLRRLGAKGGIFALGLVETRPGLPAPVDYMDGAPPYTALWFTSPVSRTNPCAALADKFQSAPSQAATP